MYVIALAHEDVDRKPGSCVKKGVLAPSERTSITFLPIECAGVSTGSSTSWSPSSSLQLSLTRVQAAFFATGVQESSLSRLVRDREYDRERTMTPLWLGEGSSSKASGLPSAPWHYKIEVSSESRGFRVNVK